jgi:hypothetical protein
MGKSVDAEEVFSLCHQFIAIRRYDMFSGGVL